MGTPTSRPVGISTPASPPIKVPTQLNDLMISFIRTSAAAIVGAVLTWLATRGVKIDSGTTTIAVLTLAWSLTSAWYLLVRTGEQYVSRHLGWLLLWARKPRYPV